MAATRTLPQINEPVLTFGSFCLLTQQREILHIDRPVHLGSRAREILLLLIERAGETVKKSELIARVWPGLIVEEGALRVHIAALRKALKDGHEGTRYIENVTGIGYRFVAKVERHEVPAGHVEQSRIWGREEEMKALLCLLQQRRLVSLVGPGGIGKTTLAMAAMAAAGKSYRDGVRFIDLTSISNVTELPSVVAAALGEKTVQNFSFLKNRRVLLLLDNCEQMIEAVAQAVEAIHAQAPGVHILATSREPLRAANESVLRLQPLPVPPATSALTVNQALEFAAIRLFVERASQNCAHFSLTPADLHAVVAICHRLDGVPLWIELAAARVGLVGVHELAAHLDDLLGFLTEGRRTAPARQRTLRATFDWSYELLSPGEKRMLLRLTALESSFDLACAQQMLVTVDIDAAEVSDLIMSLASKSLLFTAVEPERVLFRLPAIARAYAMKKHAAAVSTS